MIFERSFAVFSLLFMVFASVFVLSLLAMLNVWLVIVGLPTAIMLIWHATLFLIEVWPCDADHNAVSDN